MFSEIIVQQFGILGLAWGGMMLWAAVTYWYVTR